MVISDRFWSATIDELKQGFIYDESAGAYYCLICGESFEEGEVFQQQQTGKWYEARKQTTHHVQQTHGSMLDYLLELDKKATGLTDLQKELVSGFAANLSDSEMMERTGIGSASTIRNHRFVLKEKAKQAKLLLAVLELMEQGVSEAPKFIPVHRTATQVDERYAITEEEYTNVIKKHLPNGPDGPLASFPGKEKKRIAVLRHIYSYFKSGVIYTEKEVNELLSKFWAEDYVMLRRYMIEYGYLSRKDDGSEYWVKEAGIGDAEKKQQKEESKDISPAPALKTEQKKQKKQEQSLKENKKQGKDEKSMDKALRKQLTAEYQERERMMGVFQIKNDVNGKIYIGSSTNMDSVWGKEQFVLNIDGHANKELQKEWKQFGGKNFSYLILETVKFDQKLRYDYKDVFDAEGRQPADTVRQYNREVAELKRKWLDQLQPYGEKGYHRLSDEAAE